MQEYGRVFAEVYSKRWTQFSAFMGPLVKSCYEKLGAAAGDSSRSLLDLCCGTGQLCNLFLQDGYSVLGVDRSPHMLHHARQLNAAYLESGKARFVQAEVSSYQAEGQYGLIVSLFDSLNHLEGLPELARCFAHARRALAPGGMFLFDLNTAEGLKRWTGTSFQGDEEVTLLLRGIYEPGMPKAFTQITGFLRRQSGLFERFDEVVYNTVVAVAEVQEALRGSGFGAVRTVSARDLEQSLEDHEKAARVVFIARH